MIAQTIELTEIMTPIIAGILINGICKRSAGQPIIDYRDYY